MKRIISAIIAILAIGMPAFSQSSLDLRSILSGLASSGDSTSSSTGAGKLGNLLGNIFASSDISVARMAGSWTYSAPAVSFKSDNLLQQAGGIAAATALENKLEPYYKRAGLTSLSLTVEADSTFTMKFGKATLKGLIAPAPDGAEANFVFNFTIAGKMNIGQMDAYVTMSGNNSMSLMFDVSKLTKLVEMSATLTGSSTAKSLSALLKSYDGICAGFKMLKNNN